MTNKPRFMLIERVDEARSDSLPPGYSKVADSQTLEEMVRVVGEQTGRALPTEGEMDAILETEMELGMGDDEPDDDGWDDDWGVDF